MIRITRRASTVAACAVVALGVLIAPVVAHAAAAVGEKAPDFTLTDTDGNTHALKDYVDAGKIVVLEWFNPDCPFIKKHHETFHTMIDLEKKYRDDGVVWFAINSGAPGKQGHGLERNRAAREIYHMSYPILLDESGDVGKSYGAKTTPHMFVINRDGTLVYAGAIDNDRSAGTLGKTNYVDDALTALLAGRQVAVAETGSYGCGVKYAD